MLKCNYCIIVMCLLSLSNKLNSGGSYHIEIFSVTLQVFDYNYLGRKAITNAALCLVSNPTNVVEVVN